ncbi:alpha-2-macroglobulin family protein [Rhodobacteraceae bacterium B1Z28]|uniref:Alpha-2-macroglobulin family protein n=1 Tax=Ruegeria haliotis TaxID=2747601 RepID=A0ABX2PPP7_9RHOB|nr:alpha-2-macroglobulin family protein [Ruegeria haliotis]NVO56097.1 alpha-2-macroglobulin family protein [Ruegeria haliotis]
MHRFVLISIAYIFSFFLLPTAAFAQSTVPEFRYVTTRDADFYGSDLDALFDTDLKSCIQACSSNDRCTAFTYNTRSDACFPKSGVTRQEPYEGALSAQKITLTEQTLTLVKMRTEALDILPSADLIRAAQQARDLGFLHSADGRDLETVLEAALGAANVTQAMQWTGVAVSLSDAPDLWVEYARLLLAMNPSGWSEKRDLRNRALSAAINGYLRADSTGTQIAALLTLANALEEVERGRDMIPVLRLAEQVQPREDVLATLDQAIGKYGFRVKDSTVESNAAAPRICVEFSEPLVKAGVDYDPFVQRSDEGLVVQVDEAQLCIDGVAHGQRYRLTLREGLPAASGETLNRNVELTHYVRDRAPAVRFPGRSYVLPKSVDAALPVETVNVTELELILRRVSDRNLLRTVQQDFFGRPLSEWQEQEFSDEIAEDIWTGTAEVSNQLNQTMTARLPMAEAIAGRPAGIYALTARVPGADPYDDPGATQWFVLSDLGISTALGTDGLHVTVRGLHNAEPRDGIEVSLVSNANAVLAKVQTDADGYARFEPGLTRGTGASAPALVMVTDGDTDFSFLSLTDPAFDLSDRGVEGRAPAGPVDVFLTTDRGAYRAGEVIHVTALSRDAQAQAIEGLPLTAILNRPDGVEYRRAVSDGGVAGGHVFALPVAADVPRGTWKIEIKSDPKGKALARQTVLVEDFLPERIDFDLTLPDAPLRPGDSPPLHIDARYLFGAPGSDLTIDGQVISRPAETVPGFDGYRFGRYDAEVPIKSSYFGDVRTNAAGQADIAVKVPVLETSGKPIEATVIARLSDGSGRPVERRLTVPVLPSQPVIGIKPMFDDVIPEGTEAAFQIVGLTPDLTATPMRLSWTLNKIETRYQWYQLYGNWNWEPTTRRTRVATGEVDFTADPLTLAQPVDWGRYELVVQRVDGTYVESAVDFYAGWYQAADASTTPDRLEMSLDRDSYRPGDTAQVRIVPRMAGVAQIEVLSNHLIHRQMINVPEGETVIPIEVTQDWGAGAYVTATVIRPMDISAGQNPARTMGVAHAAVDPVGRKLNVNIDVPEISAPRQTQKARIRVENATQGDPVWLTLAAVDVGILNLTGFESPDPQGYYFGQRRLGVDLRDVYGRLIDGMNGAMGTVQSGGDNDNGMRRQSPPPTQDLMAVFSGPVQVRANGEVEIDIPLPAFNGTVRLMAVAWSRAAVGQAEADMIVRDPVVVTASLPRFLAPGDQSRMLLEIIHADGTAGDMALGLTTSSELELGAAPSSFALDQGGKVVIEVPIRAMAVGDPEISVSITTPDGRDLSQTLRMPVRANDPVVALTRRFSLGSGDSFLFSQDVFDGFQPGSAKAILSAGPLAKFDTPGLLDRLNRYPYGCTEQITSQALPLLYLSSVAQASGLGDGPVVDQRIDNSIRSVLTRQAANGAFGLWRAESGDFWLDAYVTDFLSRARAQGHPVPDRAFAQAMDNLRNRINYAPDFDQGGQDIAYALMILAREGAASMGDLRYYADVKGDAFDTPLAASQLGAALASYGDQTRADTMFARAAQMLAQRPAQNQTYWRADYGTDLRDAAGLLTLAVDAGSEAIDREALVQRVTAGRAHLSTQEATWSLLAAHALVSDPTGSGLLVNGAPIDGPFVQVLESGQAEELNITATDGGPTDITLTVNGIPDIPPEAGGTGYAIERQYYSMEGEPLDPSNTTVGDRFVTVITVTPFEGGGARLMVDDPLAAGVEIDNPSLLRSGDVRSLDWLDLSEASHTEFRSDRFLAAVDLSGRETVTLAYVARAVTPGDFHHPAASVEDMYRPQNRARTATGRVVVR